MDWRTQPGQSGVFSIRVLLTIAIYLLSLGTVLGARQLTVALTARWGQTPLLLETAQFLAREKSQRSLFWNFVEATTEKDMSNMTEHETYQWLMQYVAKVLEPRVFESFKLSLSCRFDSPSVAMYQQMSSVYKVSPDCDAFVVISNTHVVTCDVDDVEKLITEQKRKNDTSDIMTFDFDHVFPTEFANPDAVKVVLYGNLGTGSFKKFHSKLIGLAGEGKVSYFLRFFVRNLESREIDLSGYGVELAIKSTEYKAVDSKDTESSQVEELEKHGSIKGFDFRKLKELHPDLKDNLNKFQFHLVQQAEGLKPLKVWELSDLSYQTAQKIKENEEATFALTALTDLSQNFPIYASELSKVIVSRSLKDDVMVVQSYLENFVSEGSSLMLLNGLQLDIETFDPFMLTDMLYSESKIVTSLSNFGIPQKYIQSLLNLDIGVQDEDEYAIDIRDSSVMYINNLETDARYSKWPKNLQYLLQPTFPGSLRRLGRNIHHCIFILDPSELESAPYITTAHEFVVNSVPCRIGISFVTNPDKDVSVKLSRIIGFIIAEEEPLDAALFLKNLFKNFQLSGMDEITDGLIENEFKMKYKHQDFKSIIKDTNYDEIGEKGRQFYAKSGLGSLPQLLYNGKPITVSHINNLDEVLVSEIYSGTFPWQKAVWEGDVSESTDLLDYTMNQNHVMPRLNDRVLSKTASTFLDFSKYDTKSDIKQMSQAEMTQYVSDKMLYVAKKDPEFDKGVTLWVAANFEEAKGRALAYQALKYLKKSDSMRIGFLFNYKYGENSLITDAILATLLSQTNHNAKLFITKLVKEEHVEDLKNGRKTMKDLEVTGMDSDKFEEVFKNKEKLKNVYEEHLFYCKQVLHASETDQMLIANGKVIGPFRGNEEFTFDDFGLVDKYIHVLSAKMISKTLKAMQIPEFFGNKLSDLIMKITACLLGNAPDKERINLPVGVLKDRPSVVHLAARLPQEPFHKIQVVLDPLSRAAQKISPVLEILHKILNVEVTVFMNCVRKWSEMPLNSFYRYVMPASLEFDSSGKLSGEKASAKFSELPPATLLTLHMHTPESWLVEAVKTPYDLDNLMLKDIQDDNPRANYELAHILLEGQCYEKQSGQPPRGLQFTLGTKTDPEMFDTIVMANLGYFQLKASPGSWTLQLRNGRSKDIYDISSTKFTSTPAGILDQVVVCMRSFTNRFIQVFVNKKPGMQLEDVLGEVEGDSEDDTTASAGIWDSVKSSLFGSSDDSSDECENNPNLEHCLKGEKEIEPLNIFSVASGHLYERLMRVMMLSVLKNTKTPVKFWFLKNYLSPSFKESLDIMKEEYEFDYALVEYKWPRWLNQQTDKQRIIWGYKILFLDVLFPLSVKKIIFVDADQIVRADLTELRDLDLEGAPYGYTPFCDDRRDMEGFRFWKSGYWASHLAGRKYHISALYVIDLQKFRKIAAGDRLRGQYQGLSQDPNSLANLDQDLPNNMIHQVRIKSLPQEWLWCETWCSMESLARAKTIDLCNNPQTKEPKLQRAMRIVPEWKEYDSEIRSLLDKKSFNKQVSDEKTESSQKESRSRHDHSDL